MFRNFYGIEKSKIANLIPKLLTSLVGPSREFCFKKLEPLSKKITLYNAQITQCYDLVSLKFQPRHKISK